MKSSCISLVIIIIEGENEHLSVIFIFPSSKDILFCNSACKSSKEAKNIQVLHGNWITEHTAWARISDKWSKWRWVSSHRKCALLWASAEPCLPTGTTAYSTGTPCIITPWGSEGMATWHLNCYLKVLHWELSLSKSTGHRFNQKFPHSFSKNSSYFLNINPGRRFYPKPLGSSFHGCISLKCKLVSLLSSLSLQGEPD